jgi:hypothetical protein
MLPGDTLTRDGCLAFLSERVPGFHVGGKTALAWRGVRQDVTFREVLTLWGDQPKPLPTWFTERFASHYQATQLFNTKLRKEFGLQPLPNGRPEVLVSVPERALLELLSDVGKTQSLDEARQLVDNTQMNYWLAETTNLSECHLPLFDLIEGLSVNGRKTAEINYGAHGWVAHHNTDIWRHTAPTGDGTGDPKWANWPMSASWLCHHL